MSVLAAGATAGGPSSCPGLLRLLGLLLALSLVLALLDLRGLSGRAGWLAAPDTVLPLDAEPAPAALQLKAEPAPAALPLEAEPASAALEPVPCPSGAAAGSKPTGVVRLDPLAPFDEQVSRVCALGFEAWSLPNGSAAVRALLATPRHRFSWPWPRPARFCDDELRKWHDQYGNGAAMQRVCEAAGQPGGPPRGPVLSAPLFELPPSERPLLARVRDSLVTFEGAVVLPSGVQVQGGHCCYCRAKLHFKNSTRAFACAEAPSAASATSAASAANAADAESADARAAGHALAACELPRISEIMILSSVYGGEPAHVFKEALPRLGPWLPWLRANPHVALHLKSRSHRSEVGNFTLQALQLLGILGPERVVVTGDLAARVAWLPASSTCGQVADQFWGARRVRDELLRAAIVGEARARGQARERVVVLVERRATDHRTWGRPDIYRKALEAVHAAADPARARVVLFSDADEALMSCLACQIRIFSSADAVVGQHGAGLTHAMFMRPGGSKCGQCGRSEISLPFLTRRPDPQS
jgi:hypothetical protein